MDNDSRGSELHYERDVLFTYKTGHIDWHGLVFSNFEYISKKPNFSI
jgi:hypothetical protein